MATVYFSLIVFAAITLTPMLWLVAASVKHPKFIFSDTFFGPVSGEAVHEVPKEGATPPFSKDDMEEIEVEGLFPHLSTYNFENLFNSVPFGRYVMNSFFVTCASVLIQLLFASLGGFALAKYEFRGKTLIMILMLMTMMIPGQVMLAPLYELIYRIGFVDTYMGLIIPGAVSVFGMFLFRQSMLHIPNDLLEAGRVDGCSEFRVYWSIALPVTRPMIGAFTLISFMAAWNNFLWPQIILQTQERFTLTIGLNQMTGIYKGNEGAIMAGTLLSVLPVVGLFFMLQKEFISGLTAGAVRG